MLQSLKFVQGAVSRKDYVAALTYFRVEAGRVTGYNGKMCLSAPIALPENCCPKADQFVKAIEACNETVELHMTKAGKLAIRSGPFKAFVETIGLEDYPPIAPEGVAVAIEGELLPALRQLYAFSAEDASRPWAAGVLLNGNSGFATNNVLLAECWLGYYFPFRVILPRFAVKEILRIGEEPVGLQLTANSATFHYEGNRWLRTQLVDGEWPDVERMFAAMPHPNQVTEVPQGLFAALETLQDFMDEQMRAFLLGDRVATALEDGASVEVAGVPGSGVYNLRMLRLLDGVAQRVGFGAYPAPVPWYGDKIRGMLAGMRA